MQAAPAAAGSNPYGLVPALQQGGIIAISVFTILVIMSIFSFYILFTKLMQQQKIVSQGRKVRASFWNSPNLREASGKLDQKSAYRAIVEDALVAQEQHGKLTDPIDQHDWMGNSLARSQGSISARLGEAAADRRRGVRRAFDRPDQERRRSDPAGQRAASYRPHGYGHGSDSNQRQVRHVAGRLVRPAKPAVLAAAGAME